MRRAARWTPSAQRRRGSEAWGRARPPRAREPRKSVCSRTGAYTQNRATSLRLSVPRRGVCSSGVVGCAHIGVDMLTLVASPSRRSPARLPSIGTSASDPTPPNDDQHRAQNRCQNCCQNCCQLAPQKCQAENVVKHGVSGLSEFGHFWGLRSGPQFGVQRNRFWQHFWLTMCPSWAALLLGQGLTSLPWPVRCVGWVSPLGIGRLWSARGRAFPSGVPYVARHGPGCHPHVLMVAHRRPYDASVSMSSELPCLPCQLASVAAVRHQWRDHLPF